jgi:hypothetical protein
VRSHLHSFVLVGLMNNNSLQDCLIGVNSAF